MAKVFIENGCLVVSVEGMRKVATLRNKLSIPLNNVVGARIDLEAWSKTPRPFQKMAGTDSYGIYFGGAFRQNGKNYFYDFGEKEVAVVVKLNNTKFEYLVLGVDEPEKAVDLINAALKNKEEDESKLSI